MFAAGHSVIGLTAIERRAVCAAQESRIVVFHFLFCRGGVMLMIRQLSLAAVMALMCSLGLGTARADWISTITAENPLHWYQFAETSGTVAADSGSAATNGTYLNGVTLGQPGLVGTAARFDGVDDHVLVGAADLAGDWTAEFIASAGAGGASQGLMGGTTMAIKAEQWSDTVKLGYTNFGVVDVTLDAATPAALTHLAFVKTDAGVTAYVNGSMVASDATTAVLSRNVIGAGAQVPRSSIRWMA